VLFGTVQQAYDLGAAAVAPPSILGSDQKHPSDRRNQPGPSRTAHQLGMATVLWCYLRNNAFKKDKDYHLSADLTGQANHLGVTIEANIIKQKLPENTAATRLSTWAIPATANLISGIYNRSLQRPPHRPDPYQVATATWAALALINSGGASGANDFEEAVATAVITSALAVPASSPAARPSSAL